MVGNHSTEVTMNNHISEIGTSLQKLSLGDSTDRRDRCQYGEFETFWILSHQDGILGRRISAKASDTFF